MLRFHFLSREFDGLNWNWNSHCPQPPPPPHLVSLDWRHLIVTPCPWPWLWTQLWRCGGGGVRDPNKTTAERRWPLPLPNKISLRSDARFKPGRISYPQNRIGSVLRFSPVVGIGTPPTPHPQGGAHSLAREGVGESQFRRGDIHCCTLYIYVLSAHTTGIAYTVTMLGSFARTS